MNAALFKALLALIPACLLLSGSTILFFRGKTRKDSDSTNATRRGFVHRASRTDPRVRGAALVSSHALGTRARRWSLRGFSGRDTRSHTFSCGTLPSSDTSEPLQRVVARNRHCTNEGLAKIEIWAALCPHK